MGLLDCFRRKPPIRDAAAVATFIDENAAFLMQKGHLRIFPRARRALRQGAVRRSRNSRPRSRCHAGAPIRSASRWSPRWWKACCASASAAERGEALQALSEHRARVCSIAIRFPRRSATDEWRDLRAELARRLQLIGLHPPKRVIDIPEQWAQAYFDLMPIHEKLRGRDFPTTRNYLRVATLQHPRRVREAAGPAGASRRRSATPRSPDAIERPVRASDRIGLYLMRRIVRDCCGAAVRRSGSCRGVVLSLRDRRRSSAVSRRVARGRVRPVRRRRRSPRPARSTTRPRCSTAAATSISCCSISPCRACAASPA